MPRFCSCVVEHLICIEYRMLCIKSHRSHGRRRSIASSAQWTVRAFIITVVDGAVADIIVIVSRHVRACVPHAGASVCGEIYANTFTTHRTCLRYHNNAAMCCGTFAASDEHLFNIRNTFAESMRRGGREVGGCAVCAPVHVHYPHYFTT